MPSTPIYLSLGSNVGNRAENLRRSIAACDPIGVRILKISSIYETEPVDYLEQPWFLNCVVQGETELSPVELLHALRGIEARMGSKKAFAKGPRLIDIDILLYGVETISSPELRVPHPQMLARKFVLVPLAEIAPELKHASWSGNAEEMLRQTQDRSEVRRFEEPL
jgi:2-amino-4-hydroxy-6-hydroxymethyldihydropteridine diphosphokinase